MKEVDELLKKDLEKFLVGVRRLCDVAPYGSRHLALTSFAFNIGLGNLQSSTLRQKHNRKEYADAADQFMRWNKAGGKVLKGLTARRRDERAMYLEGT